MNTPEINIDEISNLRLIENGLLHTSFEIDRDRPSYFHVAREAHLVLYRSMVECLRGSANIPIIARPPKKPGDDCVTYQRGNQHWVQIRRSEVPGCKRAWRFTEPAICAAPMIPPVSRSRQSREDLIGFYDALGMIQTECFMGRFVHSKPCPLTNTICNAWSGFTSE